MSDKTTMPGMDTGTPVGRAAMRFYDQVCLGAKDGPTLRINVELANHDQ